jgi:hypothetical protein
MAEKHGLSYFLRKLFFRKSVLANEQKRAEDEFRLEPKYWPEVADFIEKLEHLIATHTISDSNVQHINQRIVDYVEHQINIKGSLTDLEQRYSALDVLADRILSNTLSKIAGLKHEENTHADFTEVVVAFKKRLHQRHQDEIAYYQSKIPDEKHPTSH